VCRGAIELAGSELGPELGRFNLNFVLIAAYEKSHVITINTGGLVRFVAITGSYEKMALLRFFVIPVLGCEAEFLGFAS
jgi:hypothetical protein